MSVVFYFYFGNVVCDCKFKKNYLINKLANISTRGMFSISLKSSLSSFIQSLRNPQSVSRCSSAVCCGSSLFDEADDAKMPILVDVSHDKLKVCFNGLAVSS